ncbi:MAG: hypothetical protein Q7T50_08300, partial [Candidatus Magasanikbacteria bacterium]|nr:hypothetical protein [Candidatus Magasanikbacteria bacterium]
NACLQWWSIPSSVDSVNSWCGDNKVGDDEDCECPRDADGNEVYSCASQISLAGTAVSNEYYCENCMWTQGWCGDNYIDTGYSEECDWNDSLNASPLGSQPNTGVATLAGGGNASISCENLSYAAVNAPTSAYLGGYSRRMYTDGNLGCFSHDSGTNYSGLNAQKCFYDTDYLIGSVDNDPTPNGISDPVLADGFGCTTNLFDDNLSVNTNLVHTSQDCINAGGVVVSDNVEQTGPAAGNNGAVVIDSTRDTIVGDSDFGQTFCKFTGSWVGTLGAGGICATITTGGTSGWRAFSTGGTPWTRTPSTCTAHISCSGPPCVHSMSQISTSHNIFANQGIESASVSNSNCSYDGFSCGSEGDSCVVTVTEIGCY